MAFNVSTNDNKAFSVSTGFQNYTSIISSYNNIGIGQLDTTTNSYQNWILNSPLSSAVYNCMAVTTDGTIQVACTKDKIYLFKNNVWTQIYTTSTPGVSFSCVCLSDDGVCITASDLSTGIYVSTNSGTTFTIISITNAKMVCMSKNGLYQTVINSGNIYTTTDKWATSNGLGVTSPTSLCMSYDGSRQIVFAFFPGRPPAPDLRLLYLSTNYGSTFTTIPQPTLLNRIVSCNCSSDGIIVTAVSDETATSKVYVSTSPTILFNQVFSTSIQVPTVFSMSLSATGISQWCVIGGNMYQSTDTGSTWTPVSNLPTQASFWAQACVSGDNSIVTIVGLDTVNTIGYIYYSKTSSSTVSSDKPLLYGLGQSIDYVISLDRMLGL